MRFFEFLMGLWIVAKKSSIFSIQSNQLLRWSDDDADVDDV